MSMEKARSRLPLTPNISLDVLNVLDSEGLHIELTEPLRPGLVRPTENTDYLCVLMPMQVV